MRPNSPSSAPTGRRRAFLPCFGVLSAILAMLFWRSFLPEYVVFSNDSPLGAMTAAQNRLPGILTGLWQDLNWIGSPYPAPAPMLTTALRLVTTPLIFGKVFAPFSLLVVGLCAWFCFREYKFSQTACLLVAAATTLNSDFLGTACWGVCSQPIAFGMNFLALGALADTSSPRRWLRVALAGFAVGLGVMEAYDIGALFSMFVGAFVVVQSLAADGPPIKRIANGIGRLALVIACAGFIAAVVLMSLIGSQIKDVVGMGQDAETKARRWTEATQYSLPKLEALGIFVPGLFGLRGDSPDGEAYWGRAGSHPSWDEFVESGGKGGRPQYTFRAGAGSSYAGVLVVLVAAFGMAQSVRKLRGPFTKAERRLVWFWGGVVLVAMLLMFGRFAPFYQFFYALPYASTIRNPAKFHHIVQWALLILFAHGAEALCRVGLDAKAPPVAAGLSAHWKSFWSKATGFDRKWVTGSACFLTTVVLGWLIYGSARGSLENYLVELNRLQYLAQGATPDVAANAAAATMDAARATAKFSVGQVTRTLLFLIPSVALVAITLSAYFRGPRAKFGGALLLAVLLADLLPFNRAWVVMVNWKERYQTNTVIEFLRERPYQQRVTRLPVEQQVDMRRLPRDLAQTAQNLFQLYEGEWKQLQFQYYNLQSLDIVQEPRVATDKAAYEAVMMLSPLRRWELSNTRYVLAPAAFQGFLNQQLDAGSNRFHIARSFKLGEGECAVFDFNGALPRAKLYANWKVSTNDPARLQEWVKEIQPRVPSEWASALAAQSTTDLATLKELSDPAFDPTQAVLLAEPIPASSGTNVAGGEVKFESYAPKHIVLSAQNQSPTVLLLNDRYDPNWQVTVDGQPAKLLRCNFIMRGVFLDKPGGHRIEFKFLPPVTGLYVSLAALALGLALIGYVGFSTRRASPPTPAVELKPKEPAKKTAAA